jgi:hypothetical protein
VCTFYVPFTNYVVTFIVNSSLLCRLRSFALQEEVLSLILNQSQELEQEIDEMECAFYGR